MRMDRETERRDLSCLSFLWELGLCIVAPIAFAYVPLSSLVGCGHKFMCFFSPCQQETESESSAQKIFELTCLLSYKVKTNFS